MANYHYNWNRTNQQGVSFSDFDSVRITVATSQDILNWSYGEVLKPDTINYRTQNPERDGLFCERIFGPVRDINPFSHRYRGIRTREAAVDRSGALVTRSAVRRERMGHIKLATPVAHIWFFRNLPSPIGLISNISVKNLEKVIYFTNYLILNIKTDKIVGLLDEINQKLDDTTKNLDEFQAKLDSRINTPPTEDQTAHLNQLKIEQASLRAQSDQLDELAQKKKFSLIAEIDYRSLPMRLKNCLKVEMGGEAIYQMLKEINVDEVIDQLQTDLEKTRSQTQRKAILKRLRTLEGIKQANIKIEDMCLTVLPVLPPNLRPIIHLPGGRVATSDINDLYRRVINRNNRLKKLMENDAPNIVIINEKRLVQEAVDALIDNNSTRSSNPTTDSSRRKLKSLTDNIKGKRGRMRLNLLGKRVDYSGRSTIVSGPQLKIDECGLPKTMVLELFRPFVAGQIVSNDQAPNVPVAMRLIDTQSDLVWDALDQVIEGKYVLLNRAPSLHRLSVQAFRPVLVEGKAIQLPPLVCKGFNADFDGDAMAVHLPLSAKAQQEARELMVPNFNLLHPADGRPVMHLTQDIVLGLYYLTYDKFANQPATHKFMSPAEAIFALDSNKIEIQTPVMIRFRGQVRQTTLGRVFFNEVFSDDFPYQNRAMDQKAISEVMALVYDSYENWQTADIANKLKDLGFEYSTVSGLSIGMGDLINIEGRQSVSQAGRDRVFEISQAYDKGLINDDERYRLTINNWHEVDDKILSLVKEQFQQKPTDLKLIVDSGARGGKVNIGQVKRMIVSVGVLSDSIGRAIEMPVNHGYADGLSPLEYFVAARGTRKTIIEIALSTADSGYLTRKLVYATQDVFTVDDSDLVDPGFYVGRNDFKEVGVDSVGLAKRLVGRYSAQEVTIDDQTILNRGDLITRNLAAEIEQSDLDGIYILSVLSCPDLNGIPVKSYGIDLANGQLVKPNSPIGVTAAQSVGEPSTQLKLDAKHTGGVAAASRHSTATGFNRAEELLEARSPKGVGCLADATGTVIVEQEDNFYRLAIILQPDQVVTHPVGDAGQINVEVDQTVKKGEIMGSRADQSVIFSQIGGRVTSVDDNQISIQPTEPAMRFNHPVSSQARVTVEVDQAVTKGQVLAINSDGVEVISQVDGLVDSTDGNQVIVKIIVVEQGKVPIEQKLVVKSGDRVNRGDLLSDGSLSLDQVLEIRGLAPTQKYILIGISKIFAQQGNYVADKHLEVIIRQMFSRVKIIDAGDSQFIDGDFVTKDSLQVANQKLLANGQQPATWQQLVLGISKVTETSDSFLLAAGFQNTKQVLVGSAIRGRVDPLKGLLENVILGRLIAVGTGAKSYQVAKEIDPAQPDELTESELTTSHQAPVEVN